MIREAAVEDIPRLLAMGERFAVKARLADHVGYDSASMAATFKLLIEGGHPVFIGESGAIGGTCTPHVFNHAHICVQELFWWSEGGEGMRLLRALENYARERGASLRLCHMEAIEPDKLDRVYRKLGYQLVERGYVKVF